MVQTTLPLNSQIIFCPLLGKLGFKKKEKKRKLACLGKTKLLLMNPLRVINITVICIT